VDNLIFAALSDPTRLRLVELLAGRPYTVGELAKVLGIRQPQATKHLQTLSRAGLVTVHPLAQRRIYALDRKPLLEVRRWLEGIDEGDDAAALDVLERYQQAIELERAAAEADPDWARGRTVALEQAVAAEPERVWAFWTSADRLRRWFGPDFFTVSRCELDVRPGGAIAIELQEGDGARYQTAGAFERISRPHQLGFTLASLDAAGNPLLRTRIAVSLRASGAGTHLSLRVEVLDAPAAAAAQVAGLRLGWGQSPAKLARAAERARRPGRSGEA
jgi:uncharacterized protein YndB with AHSA1/START domain/DNA-binding transcriptional ArsR family regulator